MPDTSDPKQEELSADPRFNQQAEQKPQNTKRPALETIKWSALEFTKHEKNPEWFLAGGLIAAVFFLLAVFTKNFLFGLIVIIAAFSIYIWTQKEPKKVNFVITQKGIHIDKSFYRFENLKSFGIIDQPDDKYINLKSKKALMPKIAVPLDDQDPEKIRDFLANFLPEEEKDESLIDALGRHLKY